MIEFAAGVIITIIGFVLFESWMMRAPKVRPWRHYRAICPGCTIDRATRIAP